MSRMPRVSSRRNLTTISLLTVALFILIISVFKRSVRLRIC